MATWEMTGAELIGLLSQKLLSQVRVPGGGNEMDLTELAKVIKSLPGHHTAHRASVGSGILTTRIENVWHLRRGASHFSHFFSVPVEPPTLRPVPGILSVGRRHRETADSDDLMLLDESRMGVLEVDGPPAPRRRRTHSGRSHGARFQSPGGSGGASAGAGAGSDSGHAGDSYNGGDADGDADGGDVEVDVPEEALLASLATAMLFPGADSALLSANAQTDMSFGAHRHTCVGILDQMSESFCAVVIPKLLLLRMFMVRRKQLLAARAAFSSYVSMMARRTYAASPPMSLQMQSPGTSTERGLYDTLAMHLKKETMHDTAMAWLKSRVTTLTEYCNELCEALVGPKGNQPFKASTCRKDHAWRFTPINLHVQRFRVTPMLGPGMSADSDEFERRTATYRTVTVGAPAAHTLKFKKHGMGSLAAAVLQTRAKVAKFSHLDDDFSAGDAVRQVEDQLQSLRVSVCVCVWGGGVVVLEVTVITHSALLVVVPVFSVSGGRLRVPCGLCARHVLCDVCARGPEAAKPRMAAFASASWRSSALRRCVWTAVGPRRRVCVFRAAGALRFPHGVGKFVVHRAPRVRHAGRHVGRCGGECLPLVAVALLVPALDTSGGAPCRA